MITKKRFGYRKVNQRERIMNLFYTLIMILAVFVLAGNAFAGDQIRHNSSNLFGSGGSLGSDSLEVSAYCSEYPDGSGGTTTYGFASIYGYIDNSLVDVYENYNGLDGCPDFFKNLNSGKKDQVNVSVEGIVVTADCTNQVIYTGSGNGQLKFSGQKPQNFTFHSKTHWTADASDGSCVISATNADGVTETFGDYASVNVSSELDTTNH
jgi:hypothetical protein